MTDLERFAAALLSQWQGEGGKGGGPIEVGSLLDRTLPYRLARRVLGIDISEDYEALVLRLIAQEGALSVTVPAEAAEMARTNLAAKLPDLDMLRLLRAATITFTADTMSRLDGVLPMPTREESRWAAEAAASATANAPSEPVRDNVIQLPVAAAPVSAAPKPTGPPPEFLTTVTFTPPEDQHCWSCSELLPVNRTVNYCPFCGSDQRAPTCNTCQAPVERRWKHCPDCGATLWPQ